MDNPIHREYHEDEGILGNSPMLFEDKGVDTDIVREKRKTSINKRLVNLNVVNQKQERDLYAVNQKQGKDLYAVNQKQEKRSIRQNQNVRLKNYLQS